MIFLNKLFNVENIIKMAKFPNPFRPQFHGVGGVAVTVYLLHSSKFPPLLPECWFTIIMQREVQFLLHTKKNELVSAKSRVVRVIMVELQEGAALSAATTMMIYLIWFAWRPATRGPVACN